MRGDKDIGRVALQVSIALSAGVFSIMPSVSAAPVLDHVVSGGAVVDQKSTPQVTDITSKTRNNVIDWKDFSVAQGERVRFDGGEKINNYLNVVSGANTSHIDGAIKGGNNVYIVNPNGVVFGSSASVDVGSLYVSTRPLDSINYDKTDANGDMQPLADTASMGGADIVNMGTVQANSVFVEGGNIILADVDRIKTADGLAVNNNVTIQTEGNITLGRSVSAMVEEEKAGMLKASLLKATGSGLTAKKLGANYKYTANSLTSSMGAIYDEEDLAGVNNNLSGSYQMMNDVAVTATKWTPLGDASKPFTGTFDGQYHTVSGIKVSSGTYGGLFGYTDGATIQNLGVKNVDITADYAGGIAGRAKNTIFTNVFNAGGEVNPANSALEGYQGQYYAGGIVGYADGGEVSVAYNNAALEAGGGIVGWGAGNLSIENAYNTAATNGIIGASNSSLITIKDVYTTGAMLYDANAELTPTGYAGKNVTSTSSADYTGLDISNSGSDDTVWRIYEGQTLPLLRPLLRRGGSAVTVNYSYTHGEQSGSNRGQDLTANSVTADDSKLVYNGEYLKVDGTPSYSGLDNIDTTQISYNTTGVKNAKTAALFYTGQQGYDLIGNNVTMGKRELNIAGQTLNYTHVYNGSADVTEELQNKIESGSAVGGIVDADKGTLKLNLTDFTATFVDSAGKADPNAADDYKDIKLDGTISLVKAGSSVTDAAVNSAMENYTFTGATGNTVNLNGTKAKGKIGKRTLYLTQKDNIAITKEYDGTSSVDDAYKANKIFSLGKVEYEVGDTTSTSGKIKNDDVTLKANDDAVKYYKVDGNEKVEAVNTGNWQVKYTGLALDGKAKDNYVLMYKNADDTETKVDTAEFFLSGSITPKLLNTTDFHVVDKDNNPVGKASKTYNGEVGYDVPNGTTLNVDDVLVERDKGVISFALATSGAYFADKDGVATANVKDAKQVKYKIQASTANAENPLSNYKLSENDADVLTDDAMEYAVEGEITRRNLEFVVKKDGIEKPYDGNGNVIGEDYIQIGGEYLDYADNLRLAAKDAAAVDNPLTVEAAYQAMSDTNRSHDVYRVNGVVTDKTINYTITMDESIAGNYTLNGKNAETPLTINKIGNESIKGKITPLTITPKFNKIIKTYDGSEAINEGDANASTYDWGTQLVKDDKVTLNYLKDKDHAYFTEADGTTRAQDVAKAAKVRYTGLSLDSGNYELSDSELTDEGEITRRLIKKDGFTVNGNEASKVYDGTIYYTLPDGATLTALAEENGNTGIVTGDQPYLKFNLSNDTTKTYFTNEAGTKTASDVESAKKVAYAVDAVTEPGHEILLGNYKLGTSADDAVNLDDNTTGLHVSGDGHIDRRDLTITAEGVQDINKTYDTTDAVENEGNSDYFTMGKAVKYGSNSKKLVSEEGTNDGTSWNIIATYNDADVYHRDNDPQKEVVNNGKDVTFKVYIAGDAAKNYTLNGQKAEIYTESNRLNLTGAKGTINQATITPVFNKITKKYTGTKAIMDGGANSSSVKELNGNLDGNNVTLNYSTDEAHAYFSDSKVGDYDGGVTYTGFSLAGDKSGNYKLSSDTVYGDGKINKYTLTSAPTITFEHVNKEYDGTNDVVYSRNEAEDDPKKFINATVTTSNGEESLGFDLESAIYKEGSFVNSDDGQTIRAGGAHNAAEFTIKFSSDNYEFSSDVMDDNFTQLKDGSYRYIVTDNNATITPRTITVTKGDTLSNNTNHYVTKIYNGDKSVKQVITREMFQFGNGDVLEEDNGKVYLAYNSDDGEGVKAEYTDKHAGEQKDVEYTLKLDGTAKDNYVLKDATLPGDGDIQQRELTIKLENGDVAEKIYDGSDKMADGTNTITNTNNNHFSIVAGGPDTGLVTGDNITVTGAKAVFDDHGNVKRRDDGQLEKQGVTFSDFTLGGNDNNDYKIVTTDLKGSGLIKPIEVTVSTAAPDKEYNKDRAIEEADIATANTNISVTPNNTISGENVKDLLKITKGEYDDYNAAPEGSKSYWYEVTLASPNYELVKGAGQEVSVNRYDAKDKGLTLTLREDTGGTIRPKKLTASIEGELTKTYDGDGISSGDAEVEKHVKINEEIYQGDDIGLQIKAEFDNDPNASASEADTESKPHNVKYTISLDSTINNGNYVLDAGSAELPGVGRINRRELTVVAEPVSVYVGGSVPDINTTHRGSVTNWANEADEEANMSFMDGLYYGTPYGDAGTKAQRAGTYAIYGWYINDADEKIPSGNLGLNYKFVQDAANDKAFTVKRASVAPTTNTMPEQSNPDTKIAPTGDIYNQISKDMSSGFGDNGAAALEYKDKNGNVIAKETIDSGEIHGTDLEMGNSLDDTSNNPDKLANIGIAGGDIVNMEGADAAGIANIEVSGDGTTVNLEVYSIQDKDSSGLGNSAAEITNADSRTGLASIEITDEKHDILGEENEDKIHKEKKEGKIAIKSNDDDDEIELNVEKQGVNVA